MGRVGGCLGCRAGKIKNLLSNYKIFSKQVNRILRSQPLNSLRASPVYPVLEDEKLKGSDKKLLKNRRTNIIDTNIV